MEVIFDRLSDVKPEDLFNFRCPYCKSDNIEIKPIGVSWLDNEDNSDIENVWLRNHLSRLKPLDVLLKETPSENLLGYCRNCKIAFRINGTIDSRTLASWIRHNVKTGSLVLNDKKDKQKA